MTGAGTRRALIRVMHLPAQQDHSSYLLSNARTCTMNLPHHTIDSFIDYTLDAQSKTIMRILVS